MIEQSVGLLDADAFGPNSYNPCMYVNNNPINNTDPSGLGKDTVSAAIEACLKLPTLAAQLKCLDDLSGSGYKQQGIKVAKCLAAAAAYKASQATANSCYSTTDCKTLLAKAAAAAAEVYGRNLYLKMKCDYILPDSIASGSAQAEAGHKTQLVQKSTYAANCAARAAQFCKPTSCAPMGGGPVIV